jgi:chromosome segregation protein
MEKSISGEQEELRLAKEEQSKLEAERTRINELLSQYRRERDGLAENYRVLGERKHKNELSASRMDMELKQGADRIWEEYELTYENAQALRHDIAVGATQQRVAGLKGEIKNLGDINVSAIEDYRTVSERYESLSTQYGDLEKAKADLYTLIGQLTKTMEQTFIVEFQKIQQNFADTFTELFGGGHAELRLSDKNDVLNCDIDIIAQPPGKKLQLLSLLSGGERALTAIALLFAMLKLKAPAFCVLDEIETSLDEANVSKFANYLKAYSDETQFIIITHRKGSMEVCDTLYGVAMEEKGISSIVSARFGETA